MADFCLWRPTALGQYLPTMPGRNRPRAVIHKIAICTSIRKARRPPQVHEADPAWYHCHHMLSQSQHLLCVHRRVRCARRSGRLDRSATRRWSLSRNSVHYLGRLVRPIFVVWKRRHFGHVRSFCPINQQNEVAMPRMASATV